MGLSIRPTEEWGPLRGEARRITCWHCRQKVAITDGATRMACPECGSQIAIHRLRMPAMPTRDEEPVVRLEVEEQEVVPASLQVEEGSRAYRGRRVSLDRGKAEEFPELEDEDENEGEGEQIGVIAERIRLESQRRIKAKKEQKQREVVATPSGPSQEEAPPTQTEQPPSPASDLRPAFRESAPPGPSLWAASLVWIAIIAGLGIMVAIVLWQTEGFAPWGVGRGGATEGSE